LLKIIHSPGIVPGAESFDPSGYVPASDITAFGTEWGFYQGETGLPFGPPGYPAADRPDGFGAYAAKNNGIVITNTFRFGAGLFVGGVPVLSAVAPSAAGFQCTVQLAALFVAPPAGTFSAMIIDSAGQGYAIADILFSELPAIGIFASFTRPAAVVANGLPINEIRITAANASNPPGSYLACSFVAFNPA
jgi:hypothetical protein